jgi:hypothetical protein
MDHPGGLLPPSTDVVTCDMAGLGIRWHRGDFGRWSVDAQTCHGIVPFNRLRTDVTIGSAEMGPASMHAATLLNLVSAEPASCEVGDRSFGESASEHFLECGASPEWDCWDFGAWVPRD